MIAFLPLQQKVIDHIKRFPQTLELFDEEHIRTFQIAADPKVNSWAAAARLVGTVKATSIRPRVSKIISTVASGVRFLERNNFPLETTPLEPRIEVLLKGIPAECYVKKEDSRYDVYFTRNSLLPDQWYVLTKRVLFQWNPSLLCGAGYLDKDLKFQKKPSDLALVSFKLKTLPLETQGLVIRVGFGVGKEHPPLDEGAKYV